MSHLGDMLEMLATADVAPGTIELIERALEIAKANAKRKSRAPAEPSPLNDLITPRDAAKRLSVSTKTLYRLAGTQGLPAVRFQGKGSGARPMVRFRVADLDAYLERQRVVGADPEIAFYADDDDEDEVSR